MRRIFRTAVGVAEARLERTVVVVCCAAPASATEATTDGGPLSWPRSVAEGVGRPRGASLPNCKLLHSISVVIEKRLRLNFFSAQRDGAKLFGNLSQSRVVGREIKKPNITNVSF